MANRAVDFKRRLQADVLRKRGLRRVRGGKLVPNSIADIPPLPPAQPSKTPTMLLIEAQTDMLIEDIVMMGSLSKVARAIHVDKTTVSKWRLHLGLRTRGDGTYKRTIEDYLPKKKEPQVLHEGTIEIKFKEEN